MLETSLASGGGVADGACPAHSASGVRPWQHAQPLPAVTVDALCPEGRVEEGLSGAWFYAAEREQLRA